MENNCNIENKPKFGKDYFKSSFFRKQILYIALGGIAGYLYYAFVGCNSGTCTFTSDPYMSAISGSFFGYAILNRPCKSC